MVGRDYESEREVEHYFIMPLMEHLGYTEIDFAMDWLVPIYQGTKKVNSRADLVVFNGTSRSNSAALLVVEAKMPDRNHKLSDDAVGQARSYANCLTTPYYIVTDGLELRVYIYRLGLSSDALHFCIARTELKASWPDLFTALNRNAVLDYKKSLTKLFQTVGVIHGKP